MFPRLAPLLLALCQALTAVHARADINAPVKKEKGPPGAPAILPMTVTAVRGQPLEIKLTGMIRHGGITFSIRTMPALCKLNAPVQKGDLAATVTYTAPLDSKADTDSFTFYAQATDTPTSEPEKVTIRITDSAAKLDVQEVADAGRLVMGHPKPLVFRIRNAGNAAWSGKVPAPKGWKWVKPAEGEFNLGPGSTADYEIDCEALAPGTLDETVTLTGAKKTRFKALVVAPFSAPESASLKWNAENRTRAGLVEVENFDKEKPVTVKVAGPEWLKFPEELILDPDGKRPLSVSVTGHFDQGFNGVLKLTAGDWTQEVKVKAVPGPALLRVVSGATENGEVAFGKLDADSIKSTSRDIVLRNEGGTAAQVKSSALKAFRIENPPPPKGLTLPPGGEANIVILPPIDTAGTNMEALTLSDGDTQVELQLTADVPASAIPATPGAIAGHELIQQPSKAASSPRPARTMSQVFKNAVINIEGAILSDGKEDRTLPKVDVVEPLPGEDGESVTFTWDQPAGEGWKYRLWYSTVERGSTGIYTKVRRACGNEVSYKTSGGKASATVGNLKPLIWYGYSVQTIAPDGRGSLPGREFRFQLSPPMPSHWETYKEWYIAGGVFVFAIGYWLWKKWKEPISAVK